MNYSKDRIRMDIIGDPANGVAGLQNDWWTAIAPDLWNSHDSYLHDVEGRDFLDLSGFFGTSVVRFDHPRIRNNAFLKQMAKIAMYRPSLADFWTTEMAEFINTFRKIAVPSYMHHLFFIDGGALAVENALKAAFDWKVRLNMQKGLINGDPQEIHQPLGTKIIHFDRAFHGRSGYSLSMTHTADVRKYKYFPKFDWFRIVAPVLHFDNDGNFTNQDEVVRQQTDALTTLKKILKSHANDIAAIIIEPIQCEGGDRHLPIEFFKSLRELADENDLLLIYDEVQSGGGSTGKMWAHEYFGPAARPDLLAFCKKMQVGGVMANYERMSRIPENVFGNNEPCKSRLNSTWGGNAVDMFRCKVFLEIIAEENLLQNAIVVGEYLLQGIRELCKEFPAIVDNPRGRGLLLAFDGKTPELKAKIWQSFYDADLLVITCGKQTIRFRPHLDLTREEAKEALKRMKIGLANIK